MTFDRAESAKTVETREGSASTLSDGLWTGKSASHELMADATPQAQEQQGIRFDPKSPDLTPGGGPAEVEKNNVERLTEQLGKKIFEKGRIIRKFGITCTAKALIALVFTNNAVG